MRQVPKSHHIVGCQRMNIGKLDLIYPIRFSNEITVCLEFTLKSVKTDMLDFIYR